MGPIRGVGVDISLLVLKLVGMVLGGVEAARDVVYLFPTIDLTTSATGIKLRPVRW
jgi:hypothetical protein